jgi:hypothetical protein
MIAPLLWLLLAALTVSQPQVVPWDGSAPVVVVRPAQPKAGKPITIGVAHLPRGAAAVDVVAEDLTASARRVGNGVRRATLFAAKAGPLSIAIRFTLRGVRYEAPGAVILVAPAS